MEDPHAPLGQPRSTAQTVGPTWLHMALVVASCLAYVSVFAFGKWLPNDDGLVALAAERVLNGDVSHQDFDDTYTGGLALHHALVMSVLGRSLRSLRYAMLLWTIPFTAVLFAVLRRFVTPWAAAALTFTAVAWSLPNYVAAVSSWFMTFFGLFMLGCLLVWLECRHTRWLIGAGLMAGLSILVKVNGLFLVATGLLTLLHCGQVASLSSGPASRRAQLGIGVVLTGFFGAVVALLQAHLIPTELVHFAGPALVLVAYLWRFEMRFARGSAANRFTGLMRLWVPFLVAAAIPVALFVLPYAVRGQLDALVAGVLVAPQRRAGATLYLPPDVLQSLAAAAPSILVLAWGARLGSRAGQPVAAVVALLGCAVIFMGDDPMVYAAVWSSLRILVVVVVGIGLWRLLKRPVDQPGTVQAFGVFASLTMANLFQYPASLGLYFLFLAPFLVLGACVASTLSDRPPVRLHAVWMGIHVAFGIAWVNPATPGAIGVHFEAPAPRAPLDVPRGGLLVHPVQAATYSLLLQVVTQHASPGGYIYATPDCPEVYFLTAQKNPTRTMYDFFDQDIGNPQVRNARLLTLLEERAVNVVVLNRVPDFSPGVDAALVASFEERFPNSVDAYPFHVRWR